MIARRLSDRTLGAFTNHYVREHISHGYASTAHSAQGATAETTHALLSENASRALAYVAMTRGRDANTAYLCEPSTEQERQDETSELGHVAVRGNSRQAATLLCGIVAHNEHPATAHDAAAETLRESLAARVSAATQRRTQAVHSRSNTFQRWRAQTLVREQAADMARGRDMGVDRSSGDWLEQ